MESIKLNNKQYQLVANGYQLTEEGGKVIFQPEAETFDEVEAELGAVSTIQLLDETGEPMISRKDLVYAGRLTKDTAYVVGTEQVENGTDEEGNPLYDLKDVTGTVMIAEFRTPDLREKYAELQEQVNNTQLALVELYEGGMA